MIKLKLSSSFWRFFLVGIINTIVGTSIMFISYNILHFSYWISTFLNYFLGSILSFFLNKYYTFKNNDKSIKQIIFFGLNIIICYAVSFGISKRVVNFLNISNSEMINGNISMFLGMILFVILNFFGQKLWVFKTKNI